MRGSLTAGRYACPAGYSGLSSRAAIAALPGADKPRQRPSARLTRGGSSDPSPYVIPTSAWRDRIGRTPVRPKGAGRPYPMDPTPGQAQPVYAQRPPHCSRRSL
ncbi:hypothetical protein D3Z39_07290 [Anaerotruncus colihominis]|uniref:Uncharacterized protein n=1 Tax=Anaerotruncus colihominis TaxID=169435 RepID=A0A845RGC0_9FIRM|nr:hypothetical protein [Anaerotruncus colihominis]